MARLVEALAWISVKGHHPEKLLGEVERLSEEKGAAGKGVLAPTSRGPGPSFLGGLLQFTAFRVLCIVASS